MPTSVNDHSVQFYLNAGIAHKDKGAFGLALIVFNEALAIEEKSEAHRNDFAEVYFQRGLVRMQIQPALYSLAIDDFKEVLKIKPSEGNAFYHMGIAQFLNKEFSEAIINLYRAISFIKDDKLQANCYRKLGQAYYALGKYSEAIENFEQSLLNLDDKTECKQYLMQAYLASGEVLLKGNTGDIVSSLTRIEPHLIKALDQKIFSSEESNRCVRLLVQSSLIQAEDLSTTETIAVLEKAVNLSKKYMIANQQDVAKCHYQLAELYHKLKKNAKDATEELKFNKLAIKNYKSVIDVLPKDDRSKLRGLAYIHLAGGLHDKSSINYYNKGLDILSDDNEFRHQAYHDCGLVLNDQKKYAAALPYFTKSIILFEKYKQYGYAALSHTNKASSHRGLNEHRDVIWHCQKAIELWDEEEKVGNPSHKYRVQFRTKLYKTIANAHLALHEYESSITANEHIILLCKEHPKLKSDIPGCYLDIAIAHLSLGNNEEAQKNIISALNYNSESIKNLAKPELKKIILHIPECYALIEVYLSSEQRKYAQKVKSSSKAGASQEAIKENSVSQSVSKLTSEPSESKLQVIAHPSTTDSFFRKFSGSKEVNENYTVLAGAEKRSWLSMWKARKVNASFSQTKVEDQALKHTI